MAKSGLVLRNRVINCYTGFSKSFQNRRRMPSNEMSTECKEDLSGLRKPYRSKSCTFSENDLIAKEPFGQFKAWFETARNTQDIYEPNAMCLATATKNGLPSARMVLLKGFSKQGFDFYTNYASRKGKELEENPNAALTFYWESLKRTVRIEGRVEKISVEESTSYFHSRPVDSQIAAAASLQSSVIRNRQEFLDKCKELADQYANKQVPKPETWGGYRVIPHAVEFWQGQSDRSHDRIKFRRLNDGDIVDSEYTHAGEDGWVFERLSP